jgi:carbon monoxide dehydrogenase subunit G
MTDVRTRVEESIHVDAAPSAVFGYCLDPRQLFAGDPKQVVDAQVTPGGVGTTAHLTMKVGVLEEDDRLEYVEVLPDRRIEMAMQPTMSPRGLGKPHHETALYSLIHEFEPEGSGTRMTLKVQVHDAPLYERMIDRLEGKGPDKMVHKRLQRIAKAVEDAAADA